MGGDGGTKSLERKYLRSVGGKQQSKQLDKKSLLQIRWSTCHISGEPLVEPIMACRIGFMYNKETILSCLLNKKIPENLSHIKKLKELTQLKLASNPDASTSNTGNISTGASSFRCPVTYLEMNGTYPFSYLRSCGCVMSDRSLKEISSATCLVCEKQFDRKKDLIRLNPEEKDIPLIREKLFEEFLKKKSKKSSKVGHSKKRKPKYDSNTNAATKDKKLPKKPCLSMPKNSVILAANKVVEASKNKSETFKKLFHSNKDKKKVSEKDLMMCVATRRYVT